MAAPVLRGEAEGQVPGARPACVPVCCPRPQVKRNSTPPLSLFGQLLWREFFYTAATNNPRFDRMEGNPICIQIPWDRNPEALAKWAEGKTGFPWIDAIMAQLRQEGWIHHLARHAVACFLTRGDLWVSWESGVRVSALSGPPPWGLGGGLGPLGPGNSLQILLGLPAAEGFDTLLWGACGEAPPGGSWFLLPASRCSMSCSWTRTSA